MARTSKSATASAAKADADWEAVQQKYADMTAAVKLEWPAVERPVTLAVLITAGANPRLTPAEYPFDEHGYYQMDWQIHSVDGLPTKTKYPWPGEQVMVDAFVAAKHEGVGVEKRGTVRD